MVQATSYPPERVLESINRIFETALQDTTDAELGNTCLGVLEELTESRFGFIGELNASGRIDCVAISDPGWAACRIPETEAMIAVTDMEVRGLYGAVVRSGEPLLTNDPANHPHAGGLPEGHPPIEAFLGVPLQQGDQTFGLVALANRPGGYGDEDLEAVQRLAGAVNQVLHRRRSERDLVDHRLRLAALIADRDRDMRAENARFQAMLDAHPDVLYVSDPQTYEVIAVNAPFAELLGEDPVGKKCYAAFQGFDAPCSFCTNETILETRKPHTWTYHNEQLDSSFHITDQIIRWPDGRDVRLELAVDITEQMKAQQALEQANRELDIRNRVARVFLLREDEELYAGVLEIVLDALQSEFGVVGYLDDQGDLVCPSMTRHVWDQCEVPQKSFVFPRDTWGDVTWCRAIRERRIVCDNEPSTRIPEGHIPIRRNLAVPVLHRGEVVGMFQAANKADDYTDADLALAQTVADALAPVLDARLKRDRAEAELHLKNLTFESAITAISIADKDATIRHVNPAFVKLWGYPDREAALGNSVASFFVDPADAGPVVEALESRGAWEGEFRAKRHDGDNFISRGFATVVRDREGNHIGYQSTNLDVTAQREAEAQLAETLANLERSNRELEQFAYVASHDLQEPLRMVASYVQLLQKRYQGQLDDDADDFIGFAVDGAQRMKQLIVDLLSYSRVETRGADFATVSMERALQAATENLELALQESGGRVEAGPLPRVNADPPQVTQLLQNLIANALKFRSDAPPRVNIQAEVKGRWVHISVADNGIGIDPSYFDKIFIIFQRLHGKADYPGTGIGLALCKRIVERHGGRIWVESTPGAGSTFHFTLPAEAQGAQGAT